MVYRLTLAYRGGAYVGWQRQPNGRSVQQVVEEALADLLGREVRVVAASRTDAGVHARGQVAHLELETAFPERGLVHGTNHRLPEDVRVVAAARAADDFHARRCALAKEYRYRLVRAAVLSPLDSPFAVRASPALDLEAMAASTAHLVGRHDFSAFALAGGAHRSPVRRIFSAEWLECGAEVVLRLVGDGFLRGMVRGLVGTLLEVGQGRRAPESLADLLSGRPRAAGGPTAPPRGLVLERVLYSSRWHAGAAQELW